MTLTEDPQKLLELRKVYVTQVEQLYQQIQTWGKGKMEFTLTEYPIGDKTGEYQTYLLTAEIIQKNPDELEGIVDFFPQGITFLTEEGVIELHGPFSEEEFVYKYKDKLMDTERYGQTMPLDDGFEDGWYWTFTNSLGKPQMHRFTEKVFLELVRGCTGYSAEELP